MINHILLNFTNRRESFQYNSTSAIRGAIKRTFKEKLYHELGLETLKKEDYTVTVLLFKNIQKQISKIPTQYYSYFLRPYNTRNVDNIPQFKVKHNFFQNPFVPSLVIEWNKLDQNIRNSENLNIFKKKLLKFIRLSENSVFRCHNPNRV